MICANPLAAALAAIVEPHTVVQEAFQKACSTLASGSPARIHWERGSSGNGDPGGMDRRSGGTFRSARSMSWHSRGGIRHVRGLEVLFTSLWDVTVIGGKTSNLYL